MPRKREVKPDFYTHWDLYELDEEAGTGGLIRLSYQGLWACADREGRFEWKPKRLKHHIIPHDSADFGEILNHLHRGGFIRRYVVDGRDYGWIPTFKEHQRVHPDEARSKLPVPTASNTISYDPMRSHEIPGDSEESPEIPGNRRESPPSSSGPSGPSSSSGKEEAPKGAELTAPPVRLADSLIEQFPELAGQTPATRRSA